MMWLCLAKIELLIFKALYFVNRKIDSRIFAPVLRRLNRRLTYREMRSHVLQCHSRPHIVHFLGQYECNNNCEFCGFDYRTNPLQQQLTLDNFKKIMLNLRPELLYEIVFSGQGEPLLCRDLPGIVAYTRHTYPRLKLTINTNGASMKGALNKLLADNFHTVIVSLHALNREVHAQITGSDSLTETLANIKLLRDSNPQLSLILYFAYTMRNIGEIKEHLRFCHELGNCGYVGAYAKFYQQKRRFSDRHNQSHFKTPDPELSLYNHQEFSDKLVMDAMALNKTLNLSAATFPPLFKNEQQQRLDCSFPYMQVLVNVDGQVFPCGGSDIWMYDEITMKQLDFGILLSTRIDDIWNLPDYIRLRAASNGNCTKLNSRCANCSSMGFLVNSGNVKESHFVV